MESFPNDRHRRNQTLGEHMNLDLNIAPGNPKITIKAHYVHSARSSTTGNGGQRRKLIKKKVTSKGDKIYRLPSLSKCLEHEILPKSSLMLKQICEIATQNSGFIKTHFDEFIKNKAMTMLNKKNKTIEHSPESGRPYGLKQHAPIGITNLELMIDPRINIMSHPVIQTHNFSHPAFQAQSLTTQNLIMIQQKKLTQPVSNKQSSLKAANDEAQAKKDRQVKIMLPHEQPTSGVPNGQMSPISFMPLSSVSPKNHNDQHSDNASNLRAIGEGLLKSPIDSSKLKNSPRFNSSQLAMELNNPIESPNLTARASFGGSRQQRKNVYSANKQMTAGSLMSARAQTSGRQGFNNFISGTKILHDMGKNESSAQDDSPTSANGRPHLTKKDVPSLHLQSLHQIQNDSRFQQNRSGSSTSSIACMKGREVIPSLKEIMEASQRQNHSREGGAPRQQQQIAHKHFEMADTVSQRGEGGPMSAIRVQNYPFRGILSKAKNTRGGTKYNPALFGTTAVSQSGDSPVNNASNIIPKNGVGNRTARGVQQNNNAVGLGIQGFGKLSMHMSASTVMPINHFMSQGSILPSPGPMSPQASNYSQVHRYKNSTLVHPLQFLSLQHSPRDYNNQQQQQQHSPTQQGSPPQPQNLQEQIPTFNPIAGRSMRLNDFDRKHQNRYSHQTHGFNFYALSRKSVEVGGDGDYARQPNTDDLAVVYNQEHLVPEHGPTNFYMIYEASQEGGADIEREKSELMSDRARMQEHIKANVMESFQKNNVRRDMQYLSPDEWGKSIFDPQSSPNMKEVGTNSSSSALQNLQLPMEHQANTMGKFKSSNMLGNPTRQEVPLSHNIHNKQSSNHHVSTVTSLPSSTDVGKQLNNRNNVSPPINGVKHKENFTVVLPPMIAGQINQSEDFYQTLKGGQIDQLNTNIVYQNLDTMRLNREESEGDIMQASPIRSKRLSQSPIKEQPVVTQRTVVTHTQEYNQDNKLTERVQTTVYTYHSSPTIKSVYEHEQEAKSRGMIKEMIFVAPEPRDGQQMGEETNKKTVKHWGSPKKAKKTGVSWAASIINMPTLSGGGPPNEELNKGNGSPINEKQQMRQLEPFSDSDDEMAQKLMKEVMPSNYRMMKKRSKGASSTINDFSPSGTQLRTVTSNHALLSSTQDSTLRMPHNILGQRTLGIKKLDQKELLKQGGLISTPKYTHSAFFERQPRAGVAQTLGQQHQEQLQLIAYCLGTAPSKYKLDVTQMSQQFLSLVGTSAISPDPNATLYSRVAKDCEDLRDQLDNTAIPPQGGAPGKKQIRLTINDAELQQVKLKSQMSNLEQLTEDNCGALSQRDQAQTENNMTPTGTRMMRVSVDSRKHFVVNGSAVQGQKTKRKQLQQNEKYKTGTFAGYLGLPPSVNAKNGIEPKFASNVNLVYDLNELRNDKYIHPQVTVLNDIRDSSGAGQMSQMNNKIEQQLLQSINGSETPLLLQESDINEIKNLGIKTTISITHHNAAGGVIATATKNRDLLNVGTPEYAENSGNASENIKESPARGETFGRRGTQKSCISVGNKRASLENLSSGRDSPKITTVTTIIPPPAINLNQPGYMQPLGTTLRSKRKYGPSTLENPDIHMIVTTTVNYDSRTGLHEVTETSQPVITVLSNDKTVIINNTGGHQSVIDTLGGGASTNRAKNTMTPKVAMNSGTPIIDIPREISTFGAVAANVVQSRGFKKPRGVSNVYEQTQRDITLDSGPEEDDGDNTLNIKE